MCISNSSCCCLLALCRRVAAAVHQRSCRRRLRASLHAWRAAAAATRQRRHRLEHARLLLQRRQMGRLVAGWRRATLAGKLCRTLGVVQQLQAAVDRAREELEHTAQQVGWGPPAYFSVLPVAAAGSFAHYPC